MSQINQASRQEVYDAIDSERAYQDYLWNAETTLSEGRHTYEEWLTYMTDYIREAQHILSRESSQSAQAPVADIMRKVTAMGVAAMEQLGAPKRAPIR